MPSMLTLSVSPHIGRLEEVEEDDMKAILMEADCGIMTIEEQVHF